MNAYGVGGAFFFGAFSTWLAEIHAASLPGSFVRVRELFYALRNLFAPLRELLVELRERLIPLRLNLLRHLLLMSVEHSLRNRSHELNGGLCLSIRNRWKPRSPMSSTLFIAKSVNSAGRIVHGFLNAFLWCMSGVRRTIQRCKTYFCERLSQ